MTLAATNPIHLNATTANRTRAEPEARASGSEWQTALADARKALDHADPRVFGSARIARLLGLHRRLTDPALDL